MADTTDDRDFNADLVRKLAELIDETGLTEIEYGAGDWHIRVAKGGVAVAPMAAVGAPSAAAAPAPAAAEADSILDHPGMVPSPMVGIAYTAPEPGSPPFVRVGDNVAEGDTVLLIEAMKVFNPITAPKAGRIDRVFVSNGVPVEFGEPLLIID